MKLSLHNRCRGGFGRPSHNCGVAVELACRHWHRFSVKHGLQGTKALVRACVLRLAVGVQGAFLRAHRGTNAWVRPSSSSAETAEDRSQSVSCKGPNTFSDGASSIRPLALSEAFLADTRARCMGSAFSTSLNMKLHWGNWLGLLVGNNSL